MSALATSLPILTAEDHAEIRANACRIFRGKRLLEPISFKRAFVRNGGIMIPAVNGVNFADFLRLLAKVENVEELDEEIEVYEDEQRGGPTGFKANFGSGRGFYFAHGIEKARTYKKKIPQWVYSDTFIQSLLLRSFPKSKTCSRQREGAARWAAVIHLYYRNGYTHSQIAQEIGSSECKVRGVIRSIRHAAAGLRADSKKPRTNNRGANLRGNQHPRKSRV